MGFGNYKENTPKNLLGSLKHIHKERIDTSTTTFKGLMVTHVKEQVKELEDTYEIHAKSEIKQLQENLAKDLKSRTTKA